MYYVHIAIFLLITFGFGFLPPFAQITPMGMKVLGAFLGAVYGWLFIALDWPSLIALLALGISGYADSTHNLFIFGWTFQSVAQSLLSYLFAEAKKQFCSVSPHLKHVTYHFCRCKKFVNHLRQRL